MTGTPVARTHRQSAAVIDRAQAELDADRLARATRLRPHSAMVGARSSGCSMSSQPSPRKVGAVWPVSPAQPAASFQPPAASARHSTSAPASASARSRRRVEAAAASAAPSAAPRAANSSIDPRAGSGGTGASLRSAVAAIARACCSSAATGGRNASLDPFGASEPGAEREATRLARTQGSSHGQAGSAEAGRFPGDDAPVRCVSPRLVTTKRSSAPDVDWPDCGTPRGAAASVDQPGRSLALPPTLVTTRQRLSNSTLRSRSGRGGQPFGRERDGEHADRPAVAHDRDQQQGRWGGRRRAGRPRRSLLSAPGRSRPPKARPRPRVSSRAACRKAGRYPPAGRDRGRARRSGHGGFREAPRRGIGAGEVGPAMSPRAAAKASSARRRASSDASMPRAAARHVIGDAPIERGALGLPGQRVRARRRPISNGAATANGQEARRAPMVVGPPRQPPPDSLCSCTLSPKAAPDGRPRRNRQPKVVQLQRRQG